MRALVARFLLVGCLAALPLTWSTALAQPRAPRPTRARPPSPTPQATPSPATASEESSAPPSPVPADPPPADPSSSATADAPAQSDEDTTGLAVPPPTAAEASDADPSRARPRRPRRGALAAGESAEDEDDEDRRARDRWRIPSDLVNPFRDRPGLAGSRRSRDVDADSWFITDEDLLDPWESGAIGPFYSVRCEGRWCRPDSDRPVFLARPPGRGRVPVRGPRRRRARPSMDIGALVSVTTVDDTARARLEAQATVHTGAFGIGLSLSTSTGRTRVDGERFTHTRHAFAAVAQHRLSDGIVSLDLGIGAGLVVMELDETRVAPLGRAMATVGVPLFGHAELIFRADALTTFVRPGARATDDGPSAFEFGMGVGLRVSTR
jgi:hypothetical protein